MFTQRYPLLATMLLIAVLIAGCSKSFVIPNSDATSPLVLMDAVPPGGSPVTVTNHSLPFEFTVVGRRQSSMDLIATAIDDDGGVQTVQIYLDEIKKCAGGPGAFGSCTTTTMAHTPVTENADTAKSPGDQATTRRMVGYTIDMLPLSQGYTYVSVKAHAEGKNFHGRSDSTQYVTFMYRQH